MAKKAVLPAHQARSRESLRKLLDAATEVLGQYGLEGATIPRIARHAGLTPGSVYRRFHDKEALLETVILELLEQQEEKMKTGMAPFVPGQISFAGFAEKLIGGMIAAYRANAGLLRAVKQFVQARTNTPFWTRATGLEASHFERTVDLFLQYRKQIRHPDPRAAVSLALMMLVGTLYVLVVWRPEREQLKGLMPQDDETLKKELVRAVLGYLGVKD